MVVFIDFECRKDRDPVLVGLLTVDRGGETRFTQTILDPALATAVRARHGLALTPLTSLAETLAEDLERADGRLVGWSLFDYKKLLGAPGLSRRAANVIEKRYENAITPAKRWRRTYLPNWKLESNQLKPYFPATGFKPKLRADIDPQPAKWIRHIQEQMSKRGRYGNVTGPAKRHWADLLTYNRDDCEGLRFVWDTARQEVELWESFRRTTFAVDATPPVSIRVGWKSHKLDRLLRNARVKRWAFITASNPGSVGLTAATNAARHRDLIREVTRAGMSCLSGLGIGEDAQWEPEESLLVLGCSEAKAVALGRRFGQLAVVVGEREAPARLVSCRAVAG